MKPEQVFPSRLSQLTKRDKVKYFKCQFMLPLLPVGMKSSLNSC